MSHDHVVELPKHVWIMKIVQAVIAGLVLAFSCYTVAIIPNTYSGFCIFVSIFSGIALAYFFVSIHHNKGLFNWVALLVLECFNVLWWLIVWALLATSLAVISYYNDNYTVYKRDLVKRLTIGEWNAAAILIYVTLAIGLINWILYIVTLTFMSIAIHRHRKAGKPMAQGESSSSGWNNASREEKHDMQPMPSGQTYPNQAPVPMPNQYDHQQQQPSPYGNSPVPTGTHETYGGNRYP